MKAVILSAGASLRMMPVKAEVPKCFVEINGKPLLDYHIKHLRKFDISELVITIQRKHEEKSIEIANQIDMDIVFSAEDEMVGTAGGLRKALEYIDADKVLVFNADDIADVNVFRLQDLGSPAICVTSMRSAFGIVNTSGINTEGSRVISFSEKPILPYYTSIGWYYLPTTINLPEKGMLETDVFPQIADECQLKAYYHHGYWITVNTQKDIKEAEQCLK